MASQARGSVRFCYVTPPGQLASNPVESIVLEFAGVVGDRHAVVTRPSTSREPWYPRGTIIRNSRQISLVSEEETAAVARAMGLAALDPSWIGSNIAVAGIPEFSALPPGTHLFFDGGATIKIEAENGPCRISGRSIGEHVPGSSGLDLLFPKVARHKRGLVATVEKPGTIVVGEGVRVDVPAIRIAPAAQGVLL